MKNWSDQELHELVLGNWHQLNSVLTSLDEDSVLRCLVIEVCTRNRKSVRRRLHQRFTTLRAKRQLEALEAENLADLDLRERMMFVRELYELRGN